MSIPAQSETRDSARRKLGGIAIVLRAVRLVSRQRLQLTIQGLPNRWVTGPRELPGPGGGV